MMLYQSPLPKRVRALVIGGGIHGVGVLHDLSTRGWKDVHLVEKGSLASGTSSKSTKLIHGGLRYLKKIRDYGLVKEGLHERQLLAELAPDIMNPIELYFPIYKKGGMPWWMVKAGLSLYDFLAGKDGFEDHKNVAIEQVAKEMPFLSTQDIQKVYSFWDGQTDDLALVERVARSATELGAGVTENATVLKISKDNNGWLVKVRDSEGEQDISCQYLINTTGPWSNFLLEQNNIKPIYNGVNIKGIHLVFQDMGLKTGLFLQSFEDERIFFLLPWHGKTLLGTTESLYEGRPDQAGVEQSDIEYLLKKTNVYLKEPLKQKDILHEFAGLRWLASSKDNIGDTSRGFKIGENTFDRNILFTLYGGKLTAYRHVSKVIGDRILRHYGKFVPTKTSDKAFWSTGEKRDVPLAKRFT